MLRINSYFLFMYICFISGCSTAYYKTEHDKEHYISKQEPIFVFLPSDSSVEDKRFAKLLSATLKNNGFNVAQVAKCGFVFNLDEPTYEVKGSYTSYNTTNITTNTSGFVGGNYVYGSSTSTVQTPTTHHYTYHKTYKKIYLDFACIRANDTLEYVFNGFASADIDDYYANQAKMLDNLVVLMSENNDYDGYLRISGNQNVKKAIKNSHAKNFILLNVDIGVGLLQGKIGDSISLSEYGYYDDISGIVGALNMPINIRLGYLRKIRDKFYVGANMVHTKNSAEGFDIDTYQARELSSGTYYSALNTASLKSEQLGIEFVSMFKSFLLGVGLSKDINSSLTFPINETINIVKDINGLYVPLRLGYLYGIRGTNFAFSTELSSTISLSGMPSVWNSFSVHMGLYYRLPLVKH